MAVKRNIVLCLVLVAGVNVYAMSRQWQWELHEQIKFEQRHAKRLEEIKQTLTKRALIQENEDDLYPRPGISMMLENEVLMYQAAERQAQKRTQKK